MEEYINTLENTTLALYVEDNIDAVVEKFSSRNLNIECLVNEELAGKYVRGYYVVNLIQMLNLNIRCLVLGVEIKKAWKVYNRIGSLCKACGIEVYNHYGLDMSMLSATIAKKNIDYPKL